MSKPVPAFKKSGIFCFRNWNCPLMNKIRKHIYKLTCEGDYTGRYVDIKFEWYADEKYFRIYDKREGGYGYMYFLCWYKSRGRVDCFLFQGDLGTEAEAVALWKLLGKEVRG